MFHNHHLLGNDHIDIEASMVDLCNIDEWSTASGMRETQDNYLDLGTSNTPAQIVYVYNPGDVEADF